MRDFEVDLRTLLEREAATITPDRTRVRRVLTGVRRRRAGRAAGAGLLACALVGGGVAGAGATLSALDRTGKGAASQPSGPAFESEEGTYPVIAEGTFEGRRWSLTVVEDPDAAHPEDTESDNPEILFEIEGPDTDGGSFETYADWDVLAEPFFVSLEGGDGDELVMGMVADSVATVTVETDAGARFGAPIYDGGDKPVPDTDYYLAFFQADGNGEVVARDGEGDILATQPLVEPPGQDLSFECFRAGEAPPVEEERVAAAGYRDVGEGTFDGRRWTLEMIEHPDVAHPEDTESENPEILFEIEGPEPTAGAFETHQGWEIVDAPFRVGLDGTDVVLGMAATEVASVTFEGGDGSATVEASVFEGAGLPGPEGSYYVVFVPRGVAGEVVARDTAGTVLGRAAMDAEWSQQLDLRDC